ncbi:oligosaccharide flippase family protein, partial [Nostoc sp. NIES-2111]
MLNSPGKIVRGVAWTVGPFGASVVLRLASNVIISRLLTPDIFGIMVVISTIRYGVELLTDIGIEQSIVQNKNGEEPRFSNTAWTIQLLRSVLLFAILLAVSWPLASFFDVPAAYIQFSGLMIVIVGLQSPARAFLQRRLQFAARNLFELALVAANSIITVGLVFLMPTVWGVLLSNTVSTAVATAATFLLPTSKVRFTLDREFAREIISFGKWIFLSSLVAFLCGNFDRIYLGHVAPLAI